MTQSSNVTLGTLKCHVLCIAVWPYRAALLPVNSSIRIKQVSNAMYLHCSGHAEKHSLSFQLVAVLVPNRSQIRLCSLEAQIRLCCTVLVAPKSHMVYTADLVRSCNKLVMFSDLDSTGNVRSVLHAHQGGTDLKSWLAQIYRSDDTSSA